MKKNFTLLEMIIVVIIVGILSTLAISQYGIFIEKQRGKVAEAKLRTIRQAVIAFKINEGDTVGVYETITWNPNGENLGTDATNDAAWQRIGITNPNNDSSPFYYDFVDASYVSPTLPYEPYPGVVVAIRKIRPGVFDMSRYIEINVTTGEIYRTFPYN